MLNICENIMAKLNHIQQPLNFSPAFEEGNIKDWRVEVDKLENEHLESQLILKFCLRSMHLCN